MSHEHQSTNGTDTTCCVLLAADDTVESAKYEAMRSSKLRAPLPCLHSHEARLCEYVRMILCVLACFAINTLCGRFRP